MKTRTWPINAIVKPAKAPPKSTSPTATARYIQRVGLSAGIAPSASSLVQMEKGGTGAARIDRKLAIPKMTSFTTERNVGRLTRRLPTRDCDSMV